MRRRGGARERNTFDVWLQLRYLAFADENRSSHSGIAIDEISFNSVLHGRFLISSDNFIKSFSNTRS